MTPYIAHAAILLTICLLFYKLLLTRETFYQLNRIVLLACLLCAFLLPLVPVPQQYSFWNDPGQNTPAAVTTAQEVQLPGAVQLPAAGQTVLTATPQHVASVEQPVKVQEPLINRLIKWSVWLYWCGAGAFGLNLLLQLIVLLFQAYTNPFVIDGKYRIVEWNGDKSPCSFGNNIFINPAKYDWDTYNQILLHEKLHIDQRHTLDLLLAEIMVVLLWFNPFAWLYRKELENNLEFLTDEAVINYGIAPADYQLSLLKVSVPNYAMNITTNYNQSLLKKRIVMMNAKRSNLHTMWKYFMLLPLLGALVCGLNKPVALAKTIAHNPASSASLIVKHVIEDHDRNQGSWFATIKGEKIEIEFKGDDNDENHNWSSSSTFKLSELSALPKGQKGDFTLTREQGKISFNGKFDGDQGYGHYKFTANPAYITFISKQGLADVEDNDYFTFFMIDVKKGYVQFLMENGFKGISKHQVISMSALKVDAGYIRYWHKIGYKDLRPNELVSLKALKVDSTYVTDIRRAGYTELSVQQLISFKAQHITGDYINGLKRANVKAGMKSADDSPSPQEIISSKAMNVDSGYVRGMRSAGYDAVPYNQLGAMKAMHITPEYVKSFEAVGYKNIPYHELFAMKSQGITPEFIRGYQEMGYKDIPVHELIPLKSQGITPEFIRGYEAIGYKDVPVHSLIPLKSMNITPEYIKSFQDIGYKNVPLHQFLPLKSQGVTPDFIKGFNKLGFKDIPLSEAGSLKSMGITPEYVAEMQQKGFNSKDLHKYMQLKSFN